MTHVHRTEITADECEKRDVELNKIIRDRNYEIEQLREDIILLRSRLDVVHQSMDILYEFLLIPYKAPWVQYDPLVPKKIRCDRCKTEAEVGMDIMHARRFNNTHRECRK